MGIGTAFRKDVLKSAGGFNPDLQVFEYLELGLRAKGFKAVKTPELTVLHLEPESRFSFSGFLRRRAEYGFWYHSLYYLHPKKLSFYAFPIKLLGLAAFAIATLVFRDAFFLIPLVLIYIAWLVVHYQLLRKDNPVKYAASKFEHRRTKVLVYFLSVAILTLGEIAGDLGKVRGIVGSPTRK